MSTKNLKNGVIEYLKQNGFQFLKCLGEGAFGAVIAVLTPSKKEVAVKIIQKDKIWKLEDKFWPNFQHPNILPVIDTMTIDELSVKLYIMPILPKDLLFTVHSEDFRKDPDSLNRIKKWLRQILSAMEYLHNAGLCHLDIKTDNVLIDHEDNAVLCDFSGLNFVSLPLDRICSPIVFRPKECFIPGDMKDLRGQPFDLWSFSFLALNVLTSHYPQKKMGQFRNVKLDWETHIWPILKKAQKESKFKHLMKKAFPSMHLSNCDVQQALHFLKFIMKIEPNERPTTTRIKKHPFLKLDSNPFLKDLNEYFKKESKETNPFRNKKLIDLMSQVDIKQRKISKDSVQLLPIATPPSSLQDANIPSCIQHSTITEIEIYGISSTELQKDSSKNFQEKKTRNVKKWFIKQFDRMFKRKKK